MKIGRPKFHSGYGIAQGGDGLLPWEWVEERLASARNYWLVTSSGDGPPQAAPIWGLWVDGAFVFGTNPHSAKGRNLARDPRVVVHLESGDEVVMLHGRVEPLAEQSFARVREEYERKYAMEVVPSDGWHSLRPSYAHAWTETRFPADATRFDL